MNTALNAYEEVELQEAENTNHEKTPSELIAEGNVCFDESFRYMDATRKRWVLNDKLMNNDVEVPGPVTRTKMKFNLSLAVVETQMPIISDHFPSFDILPAQENDEQFADMMQKRKNQVEAQSKLKKHGLLCARDSMYYSNGLTGILPDFRMVWRDANGLDPSHPDFDKNTKKQTEYFSGIRLFEQDVFTWFPSPDATGMDIRTDARYHIFATPMHVDKVKRQYKKEVSPEGTIDEYGRFIVDKQRTMEDKGKYALVKQWYRMDEDMDNYPHGRYTIWAGDTLILDEPLWGTEITDHDEWKRVPYFMIANYRKSQSVFGIGEPELVATQVKALNQVMSSIADNINMTGNPIAKIRKAFATAYGKAISFITGKPIEVTNPDDVTWMEPPNIPSYTFAFIDKLLMLVDIVTGIHDVTEGRKPSGITAASAITALQEAAQARVRYKVANEINDYMEDVGKFMTALLQEYDEEVIIIREKVQSGNGKYQFSEYNPVQMIDQNGMKENEDGFDLNTAQTMKDSKFDIEVSIGTRIPAGRFATEQIAVEKFEKGIYGIEEYAEYSNEKDKPKLVENFYKRKGLLELKQKMEAQDQAEEAFNNLIIDSVQKQQKFIGTPQEDEAGNIIHQFPELLNSQAFQVLPANMKERLLAVFSQTER